MNKSSKIKPLILILLLMFPSFLSSCKVDNPSNSEFQPLEGKIIFSLTEGYEYQDAVSNPKIVLKMRTEKIYGCFNYSIVTRVLRLDKGISVVVSGVSISNVCLTALGPASYEEFLNLPEGEYSLIFSYWGITDRYGVKISNSSIEVVVKESNFTELEHPQ